MLIGVVLNHARLASRSSGRCVQESRFLERLNQVSPTTHACAIVAAAVAAIFIVGSPSGKADEFTVARYQGTFEYRGTSAKARRTIDQAIEEVTDEMGFLKDGIAQDRLEEELELLPTIVIAVEGKSVSITFQGVTYTSRLGGDSVLATTADGEKIRIRHYLKRRKLVEEIRTENGRRVNVFSLGDDRRMDLTVIVSSPKLPSDVRYDLMYRRKQ